MLENVIDLLQSKKYNALYEYLETLNEVDIALLLEELSDEDALRTFRLLSKDEAAEVFAYMNPEDQERLIKVMSDLELERVTTKMFLDDTVDLISEMPASIVKRILKASKNEDRKLINELLQYPDDSAGSLMTTEFVDLKSGMSVLQAIEEIRREGVSKETIYTCYVLNEKRMLQGIVSVKDLLLSQNNVLIENIMETNIIKTHTREDKEEVAKIFSKYGLLALPVVDKEDRLVGIITFDDAVDVYHEETAEDFEIMAAISPSGDTYFKTSVFRHAYRRISWLMLLMVSSLFTGAIISRYDNAFAALPLLVSFIPMLMDTGGNCGAQTSTLIIRGMATDEIRMKDFFKALFKEFRVSLICAIILAFANFLSIYVQYKNFTVALTVGLTLICTVIFAKIIGTVLPMGARFIHLDPAIMAAPLLTTIVDSASMLIYFNIVVNILKI